MREGTCQRGGQCAIREVQLQRHCMTAGMPAPRRTQTRVRALEGNKAYKKKKITGASVLWPENLISCFSFAAYAATCLASLRALWV